VEQATREENGATRVQHVVHVMPRDAAMAAGVLAGVAERAALPPDQLRALVLVPTIDDALTLVRALRAHHASTGRILPITAPPPGRAARMLALHPSVIVGTPRDVLALVSESSLKLEQLDTVALVWLDDLLRSTSGGGAADQAMALEALLSEAPKDAERVAIVTNVDHALDAFQERYMWRARRTVHENTSRPADVAIRYITVAPANSGDALRTLLDAINPASAHVVVRDADREAAARETLDTLGYAAGDEAVRVSVDLPAEAVELLVFFDGVTSGDALRQAAALCGNVVALVAPGRVTQFRAQAGSGATPLSFTGAFHAARAAEDTLRDELRGVIRGSAIAAHVLQVEPLAIEHDAVEIAAAALYLLQRERNRARRSEPGSSARSASDAPAAGASGTFRHPASPHAAPHHPAAERPSVSRLTSSRSPSGSFTRVYLGVGERDGVGRGDLVGAITGEAGIVGTQIGKIDLRETHAIVEVASDVAPLVIERLAGASIRGRRANAREDRERGAGTDTRKRGRDDRGGGGHGARGGFGGRGAARGSTSRGPRDRDRTKAGGGRGSRDDAPRRGAAAGGRGVGAESRDAAARVPRATHESAEWTDRADRLRHSRRRDRG
jgi:ATP-dependent RNA helicase DeaD